LQKITITIAMETACHDTRGGAKSAACLPGRKPWQARPIVVFVPAAQPSQSV
jgi:hypothetical protein